MARKLHILFAEDYLMQKLGTMTIREIALASPATTRVFEEFKIDYCCHGDTLFADACTDAGTSPELIKQKIAALFAGDAVLSPGARNSLSLGDLIAHILETHHIYTKKEIEQLTHLMQKVVRRHGDQHPFLFELQKIFQAVCDDLSPHMLKEEVVLFPYIVQLEQAVDKHLTGPTPHFGSVERPVRMMKIEHEAVGDLLACMREITNDYRLPDGVCPSFTALYHRLAALELDLHQHIHLENNVLFPRAIALELRAMQFSTV